MSSDVFIISSARDRDVSGAIRQAIRDAGVNSSRIQDAVFGVPVSQAPDLDSALHAMGLTCPAVAVSPAMRALSFAAASIWSEDVELSVVAGLEVPECTAVLLASPEAVGRMNLFPRARLAARSLSGMDGALKLTGLAPSDIQINKEGDRLSLLYDLLEELEAQPARWGALSCPDITFLLERI